MYAAAVSEGIEERHARSCPVRDGGACGCKPTYQAHVWDNEAKRRVRRSFKSKKAAKLWRTDTISALRKGEITSNRGPLLRHALPEWLDGIDAGRVLDRSGKAFKPATARGYRATLELRVIPKIGHFRVNDLSPRDVQLMVDKLVAEQLAPATIDAALTPLRAFYRRAVTRGEARANPTLRVEKPGVRRKQITMVDPTMVEAMLAALSGMDRVLWAIAFYAGLRRGELAALKWENVDLAKSTIKVVHGWDVVEGEIAPKSREGKRTIPLSVLLRDYLDPYHQGTGRIFQSHRWIVGSNDRAREIWRNVGLPDSYTLHSARHVYAAMCIAAGINVKAVQVFMGHANIKVTLDTYGHLLPGSEDEAGELMNAFLARSVGGSSLENERTERSRDGLAVGR